MAGVVLFSSWYLCPEILGKMMAHSGTPGKSSVAWQLTLNFLWMLWPMIAVMSAGAGINTQTFTGAVHRAHPSMLFTLSLPVSRRRLLAVRAAAGAMETVFLICFTCILLWCISPILRRQTGVTGICRYMITTAIAASVFYCLSVLYATFLDETWQFNACFITIGAILTLRLLPVSSPVSVVIRSLSNIPALVTGDLPWPSLLLCLFVSVSLFSAAMRVVERRRY
jgi:hypothetical protein